MDQETKDYLDQKFAEQEKLKNDQTAQARDFLQSRQKKVKNIVYICAGIMMILLFAELYLLYFAQFAKR